jgi:type II secretory pathway pseudopilin PulG
MSRLARRRIGGFSLVELLVALAGTAAVFGIVVLGTNRAFGTWKATVKETEVERLAARSADRVVAMLSDASLATIADDLAAPNGGSSITYQAFGPAADGTATLENSVTLSWVADASDAADGVDNDGDGLTDEGTIVRTDASGARTELVRNVAGYLDGETNNSIDDNGNGLIDERGFCLELDGRRLTVRLTLQALDEDGSVVSKSAESVVRLRD